MSKQVLLIVHKKISAMLIKRKLESSGAEVASIDILPEDTSREIGEYKCYQEQSFDIIQSQCAQKNVFSPEVIILESNYGRSGQDIFCSELYELLVSVHPRAQFVVSSTTTSSLEKALQYNERIQAMSVMLDSDSRLVSDASLPPSKNLDERLCSQGAMLIKLKEMLAEQGPVEDAAGASANVAAKVDSEEEGGRDSECIDSAQHTLVDPLEKTADALCAQYSIVPHQGKDLNLSHSTQQLPKGRTLR